MDFKFENILNQLRKRIFLTIIVGLSIALIFSAILISHYRQGKQDEFDLPEAGVPSSVSNVNNANILYNLSGIIKELGDKAVVFEAIVPYIDENNQLISKKETRKALISSNTNLTRLEIVIHKETGSEIPEEKPIDFKDLKIGNNIEVLSSQNIAKAEEFEVKKIRVLPY